ncbi:MAG: hypothetical protein HZB55_19580 [Deltaproteobacteria bacterium]|nr:hypothetical protein [Deltaproteobacteria bacterium]
MPRGLRLALVLTSLALAAPLAHAVVDVPSPERRALDVVDLACGSGIAPPADTAVLPLDDRAYLEAYQALEARGLVDPLGAERDARDAARSDGGLHLETLVPRLTLAGYVLGGAEERLLLHTAGDVLDRGLNAFLSASGEATWNRWLGAGYEVQLQESTGEVDGAVKRLYLKAQYGKWSFKIGRDSVRLGPGYRGSLLLDDNARPLDLWQVRTEEPLYLPWVLERLGGFRFTLFNAFLSDEHPSPPDPRYGSGVNAVPDPRLLGMRLSYHPALWLDLGLSRTILYSGKGRETYDTPKDWWELLTASNENVYAGQSHRYDNDQYAALDATLRLPFLRDLGPLKAGKIYWEHGGTDFNAPWSSGSNGSLRFGLLRTSDLVGLYLSTAVSDLRVEVARTDKSWYRHGQYPQGYSYDGLPLGHPMGGDAQSVFVQVSRFFSPAWKVTAGYDWEERGRHLTEEEKRSEGTLALDALGVKAFGLPLILRAEGLAARVSSPLDDPDRDDRTELYLGASVSWGWR